MGFDGWPKIVQALVVQVFVLLVLAVGVKVFSYWVAPPYEFWFLALVQGVMSALVSRRLGLPSWWGWIQLLMPAGLYSGVVLEIDPFWALLFFIVVWLFFSNTIVERVPLYLTNSTTREALRELQADEQAVRFIDLGCGMGSNVSFMAQQSQVVASHGVETAPFPYLISRLVTTVSGGRVFALDIWKTDLSAYSIVYAFLSSEPMPRLWQKVKIEMGVGALFVSNSFPVPGVEPEVVWELADKRQTRLYIYRI